jgi:hypothetical protein
MLNINKNYIVDANKNPIAVQIPIEEFEKLEELIEDYGLSKLMDEVKDDEVLTQDEAKKYYESLKKNVEN